MARIRCVGHSDSHAYDCFAVKTLHVFLGLIKYNLDKDLQRGWGRAEAFRTAHIGVPRRDACLIHIATLITTIVPKMHPNYYSSTNQVCTAYSQLKHNIASTPHHCNRWTNRVKPSLGTARRARVDGT
jgi:hypothetical protein